MLSSLLLKYFKNLTKKDRRELSKFVRSPFHNQKQEVTRLFDYLNEQLDKTTSWSKTLKTNQTASHSLKKENVFAHVFLDNQPYNDAHLRATMSQLNELIKDYFLYSEIKNNEKYKNEKAQIIRNSFLLRGAIEEYENALIYDFESFDLINGYSTFHHYVLLAERSHWQAKNKRTSDLFYNEMGHVLDAGYVVELLRLACSMQAHKTLIKANYELKLLPFVLSELKNGWLQDNFLAQAFYQAYLTICYEKENYENLDNLLTTHFDKFTLDDLNFLHKVAINYTIRMMNLGHLEYNTVAWRYLKKGIEKRFLIHNNSINPADFLTIVSLGVSSPIKEVAWVENFIENYKGYLPHKDKDNYILFIEGIFHFYLKNYKKSMSSLQKVSFDDEYEQLRCRRMMAVMYFELNEFETLTSHLEAFKVYLYRQKNMSFQRESHLNFVRFMEKTMKINIDDRNMCATLWQKIDTEKWVTLRDWFKEKLLKTA